MDKNSWLALAGLGVTLLSAALMTISHIVPAWLGVSGAIIGSIVLVIGVFGLLLSQDSTTKEATPPAGEKLTVDTKALDQNNDTQNKNLITPLSSKKIEEILNELNSAIMEAEKGVPDSDANTDLIQKIESSIRVKAAKVDGLVSDKMSLFAEELSHIRRCYTAQSYRRDKDGDNIRFRHGFLNDLRELRKEIVKMIALR